MKLIDLYADEMNSASSLRSDGIASSSAPKVFAQILSWRWAEQQVREVFPPMILLFDEVDLPLARPLLHRLRVSIGGDGSAK